MQAKLNLESRDAIGKGAARKLRRSGRVPGVVYGGDGESVLVSMEAQEALHLFQSISVDNTILELDLGGATEQALVREIQSHPHKNELVHVDFIRVQAGVAIEVQVPIHLVGVPDGVRHEGGILEHIVHDLPVRCLPRLIPESVEVDVTGLALGDALRAKDLPLPAEVENLLDPERTICLVAAPRVIEDEEPEEGELPEGVEPEEGEEGDEPVAEADESEESAD